MNKRNGVYLSIPWHCYYCNSNYNTLAFAGVFNRPFFLMGRENHRKTPPTQAGAEGSVRLFLTEHPACSFSYHLPDTRILFWMDPATLVDGYVNGFPRLKYNLFICLSMLRSDNAFFRVDTKKWFSSFEDYLLLTNTQIWPHQNLAVDLRTRVRKNKLIPFHNIRNDVRIKLCNHVSGETRVL